MSNIVLQPNASGTGNITIATPNTNTDRTLNIPDVAGDIVTTGDTGSVTQGMIGSGVVGNGPAFSAHINTGNPGITGNTWTKMTCETEIFDTDSCYNTSTYRFTPTVAGYYYVTVRAKIYTGTNQTQFTKSVRIYKNGSGYKESSIDGNFGYSNNNHHVSVSALVYLNGTTDYVEPYMLIGINGNIIGGGSVGNTFEAHMVRAA